MLILFLLIINHHYFKLHHFSANLPQLAFIFHYVIDGQENLDIPQEIAVLDNNIEKIKKII